MKLNNIKLSINLLEIEKRMSNWFMDFFDEKDNISETQQNNILYVVSTKPKLLLFVLLFCLNRVHGFIIEMNIPIKFSGIFDLISKFILGTKQCENSIIVQEKTAVTNVNNVDFKRKIFNREDIYNNNEVSNKSTYILKETNYSIIGKIFLVIFGKKLLRKSFKQLII